jgi:pantoate--beta-alanine ligase
MKIFNNIADLQSEIRNHKANGNTIGFVPTMGALHRGHISLVDASKAACDITVVSIFVNPTQFNKRSDFEHYPITLKKDIKQLTEAGCDILFNPDEKEMYPVPDNRTFEFDGIDQVMEGHFRPGHFNGVAQIVSKLFDAVTPDQAFFGQKDFQQLAIIKHLVKSEAYTIKVNGTPIVREEDGLAMSSRNVRLSPVERAKSVRISQVLFEVKQKVWNTPVEEIIEWVESQFKNDPDFKFEYFDIVNAGTLQSINSWNEGEEMNACIAVFVGNVRLIDNIFLSI